VPAAVMRFLESDSTTKTLAKPQLRGAEGQKLSLNLGEDVPVPSTTFTPIAGGGAATQPLTSFAYRTVGIIVEMTPRVTYEGEIILEMSVESSARGQDTNIAGQNLPSFLSRKVVTKLRLRDGESNLLAGLLREDERRSLRGFPGVLRLPVVRQLFSANDEAIRSSDIVMLLTPRIIRTHELTATDLSPIYVGTQSNMGLGGPPPLINVGGAAGEPPPAAGAGAATPGATAPTGTGTQQALPQPFPPGTPTPVLPSGAQGVKPQVPPGSSPIPGTTAVPAPPPTPQPGVTVFAPVEPPATTPAPAPPAATPPPATPFGTPVTPTAPPAAGAPTTPPAGAPATPPAAATPDPAAAAAGATTAATRVTLSPPSEMRVGSGPYTVPVSIAGASRLSAVTVSVTFNPALLRVRSVSEGTFMRQGNVTPTFTQQVDAGAGRIDIAIVRAGDQVGASTSGLLAAILFEPVSAGTGTLTVSGSGTQAGGGAATLQFSPVGVVVR
jgi:hypothetical protein